MELAMIAKAIELGDLVVWVPTRQQLADALVQILAVDLVKVLINGTLKF